MTHVAWAPPQWAAAARRTLAGLEELHPSRTILLFPDPQARDGIDVHVELKCFTIDGSSREVVLGGDRAAAGRRAHARARLDRPAAPDHRPADLLPLARAAAVGQRRSSSSSSTSATGSSSTRPSGAASRRLREARSSSSTGSPSRTSPGARASAGAAGSRRSGRSVEDGEDALGHGAEGGRAPARRLAALAAEASRSSCRIGSAPSSSASPSTASRCRRRAGLAAEPERPALGRARRLRPRPDLRGGGQRSSLTSSRPFQETDSS